MHAAPLTAHEPMVAWFDRPCLNVTRSTFAATALQTEVAGNYTLGKPLGCQLIKPGLNDTYLLTTEQGRYIIRVYGSGWESVSGIDYELALIAHLSGKGVMVAAPLADREGHWKRTVLAPEGSRDLVVFPFVDGTPIDWDNTAQCYLAGRTAANIHAASEDFRGATGHGQLDLSLLIDRPLASIRPFLSACHESWVFLLRYADRLRARVQAAMEQGLSWSVCHGDFGAKNLLINESQQITVLDFEHCGAGWCVLDCAPCYRKSVRRHRPEIWESFRDGYTAARRLTTADLQAVSLFVALRELFAIGLFAEKATEWGVALMDEHKLDGLLNFFRDWEATQLGGDAVIPLAASNMNVSNQRHEYSDHEIVSARARCLPVSHSVVVATALSREVSEAYGSVIGQPYGCHLLAAGNRHTYRLRAGGRSYRACLVRARDRLVADLEYELELLRHLDGKGLPVPTPVLDAAGRWIHSVTAPEGERQLVLVTEVEGQPIRWDNAVDARQAGLLAARFHKAVGDFVGRPARRALDLDELINRPIAALQPYVVAYPEAWKFLEGLAARLRRRMEELRDNLRWGICHGDWQAKNLVWTDRDLLAIADVLHGGPGWQGYDLAPCYAEAVRLKRRDVWEAFVNGYTEVLPLEAAEVKAAPVFVALWLFSMLGMFAENAADWGIDNLRHRELEGWVTLLRDWETDQLAGL